MTLTIGVLAAFGVDFLRTRLRLFGNVVAHVLVAALVLDLWWVGPPALRHMFGGKQAVRPVSHEFRQAVTAAAQDQMLSFALANMGAVECYEYTVFRTRVRGDGDAAYRGEQYLLGPGLVRLVEWTPNALRYDVDASAPTVLVVNQNYDPAWRLLEGEARSSRRGTSSRCVSARGGSR